VAKDNPPTFVIAASFPAGEPEKGRACQPVESVPPSRGKRDRTRVMGRPPSRVTGVAVRSHAGPAQSTFGAHATVIARMIRGCLTPRRSRAVAPSTIGICA